VERFNKAAGKALFQNLFRNTARIVAVKAPQDGFMMKQSRRGNWQRRWFAFRSPNLVYWRREPAWAAAAALFAAAEGLGIVGSADPVKGAGQGSAAAEEDPPDATIDLRRVRRLKVDPAALVMVLKFSSRTYHIKAADAENLQAWAATIRKMMEVNAGDDGVVHC
jgi:hypothetical protein